jgi:hypothetical protein
MIIRAHSVEKHDVQQREHAGVGKKRQQQG